jgi:predicted Zn-dependent protease
VVEAPVEVETPGPTPQAETVQPPPEWQRLANRGEYEAALFVLSEVGGFEAALEGSSPEQLMLLVDVARATGQRQRAIAALRRVVQHHPGDPVAPLAAWSLGDLLDKAGDRQGAVEAFAAYRSLSPKGDFAEDALVRELRSAVERRAAEEARALAAQYERDFPEGGRSDEVARWVALLDSPTSATGDAGAPADDLDQELGEDEAEDDGEDGVDP